MQKPDKPIDPTASGRTHTDLADLETEEKARGHEPEYDGQDLEPRFEGDTLSEDQLIERAKSLGIEGYDAMLNDELLEAIRKKEDPQRVDATRAADEADPESRSEGAA